MNKEFQIFYDKAVTWLVITGPKVLVAALVLIIGLWMIRLLRRKLRNYISKRKVNSSLRPFLESLIFTTLHIALFLLVMQLLGIQLTIFAAVIAAFGAAAGLALSGTLQNFASGVLILLLKPFKTGENIVAQGIEGNVVSIQIFYTIIKTFDNRTIIMPNSKLSNEVITNITREGSRRLDIELTFDIDVPVQAVKKMLADTFRQSSDIAPQPEFRIGVSAVDTDEYKLKINLWINAHGFEDTRLKINEAILELLTHELPALKKTATEDQKHDG